MRANKRLWLAGTFAFHNCDFQVLSLGGWKVTDHKAGGGASITHLNDKSFEFHWRKLNLIHKLVFRKLMFNNALITFLHAVAKYMTKATYGWKSLFYLRTGGYGPPCWGRHYGRSMGGRAGHAASADRKSRQMNAGMQPAFSFLFNMRPQSMGFCWVFPLHLNLSGNRQMCVTMVILSTVNLTMSINYFRHIDRAVIWIFLDQCQLYNMPLFLSVCIQAYLKKLMKAFMFIL